MKQEFRQHLRNKSEQSNCLLLSAVSNGPLDAAARFFLLTDGDDQHIKENYIEKPQPRPVEGDKQIKDIELGAEQLDELLKTGRLQLPNG